MHHNQETEPTQNAPEVDPLSVAAEGIDTSYPLLAPDQICEFEIVSAKKETVKDHTDREMLVLKLKTVKDYRGKDRNTLRSGFIVMKRIGITPRPEEDGMKERGWDEIRKDLALVLKGVGRPQATPRDLLNDPSSIEREVVKMRVGINKARDNFPESNSVNFYLPPAA